MTAELCRLTAAVCGSEGEEGGEGEGESGYIEKGGGREREPGRVRDGIESEERRIVRLSVGMGVRSSSLTCQRYRVLPLPHYLHCSSADSPLPEGCYSEPEKRLMKAC